MTVELLLQTLLSGILFGLVYALVAIGLTLIFGVMDIVNFAHGEFLMFGMYAAFWGFAFWGLDPIVTLPLTTLLLFAVGVAVYRLVIRRITDAPMLSQIFATFGLMIFFRGLAQYLWKPDFRSVDHTIVAGKVAFAGLQFGLPQVVAALGAVLTTAAVWAFLRFTRLGAALEATAADKEAAALMGIDAQKMFALAWGIGAACAGIAGALLATYYPISRRWAPPSSWWPSCWWPWAGSAAWWGPSGPGSWWASWRSWAASSGTRPTRWCSSSPST